MRRGASWLALAFAITVVASALAGYVLGASRVPAVAQGMALVPALVLALTALASFQIVRSLASSGGGAPPPEHSWEAFRIELDRSRRFDRAFVLLYAPAAANALRQPDDQARSRAVLSMMVRSVDHVWFADEGVFILLAETDRAAAEPAIDRLRTTMPETLDVAAIEIAAFPEDGLTTGALLSNLSPVADAAESDENVLRLPSHGTERRARRRTG